MIQKLSDHSFTLTEVWVSLQGWSCSTFFITSSLYLYFPAACRTFWNLVLRGLYLRILETSWGAVQKIVKIAISTAASCLVEWIHIFGQIFEAEAAEEDKARSFQVQDNFRENFHYKVASSEQ